MNSPHMSKNPRSAHLNSQWPHSLELYPPKISHNTETQTHPNSAKIRNPDWSPQQALNWMQSTFSPTAHGAETSLQTHTWPPACFAHLSAKSQPVLSRSYQNSMHPRTESGEHTKFAWPDPQFSFLYRSTQSSQRCSASLRTSPTQKSLLASS